MTDQTTEDAPVIQDEQTLTDAASLLWEEARRQNVAQLTELDLLRTRAVALLSVASLVAGLFGGRILSTHHSIRGTVATAAALVAFALGVGAVLVVLMPKWKWEFSQDLGDFLADLRARTLTPLDVAQNLAKWFELSTVKNAPKLRRLYEWFSVACVLVGVQVIAWGIAVL